jgi:hypothetical protein
VLVLPVVIAILAVALGALGLQTQRIRLFAVAADAARAAARGEHPKGVELTVEQDLVCATATARTRFSFNLTERACARAEAL